MEIRVRSTGAVMYENEFRLWLQETDGPSYVTLTAEIMELLGVDPVFEGPQASGGTVYQYSQRQGVELIGGKWYTKHVLGPVFVDTDDATAAEQEAEYIAQKDAVQADAVRNDRDNRLAACDWRVIRSLEAGTAQNFDWAVYRQALRDLPSQVGFPWNVVWPVSP